MDDDGAWKRKRLLIGVAGLAPVLAALLYLNNREPLLDLGSDDTADGAADAASDTSPSSALAMSAAADTPAADASLDGGGRVFVTDPHDAGASKTSAPAASAAMETGASPTGGRADAGGDASVPNSTDVSSTIHLDESQDGKVFAIARDQSLVVMLTASPTSGFDWAVVKAPAALGTPVMTFAAGGDTMGAAGKRRITWKLGAPLPAGEHVVELAYRRGFEPGVAPFKTFRFKVRPRP